MNDDLKPLFRRLLRRFHPDTTTEESKKAAFNELTRQIIDAYQNGDAQLLATIDQIGIDYLRSNPTPDPNEAEPCAERQSPPPPSSVPSPSSASDSPDFGYWAFLTAPLWFPYTLAFSVKSWNAACIAGAVGWGWLGIQFWEVATTLATLLQANGYRHESAIGFGVVVLRGLVLAALLPIVVPLGLVAIRVGLIVGSAWAAQWVASGLLGIIHPYLGWITSLVICGCGAIAVWRTLDEW